MANSYQKGNYSLGYIDPTDVNAKNGKQMMDWFYNSMYTGASAIWVQGMIDKRFKIGDSTLYSAAYGQNYQQYQKFFFNLVRRHGNMIAGFQRKNRKSTVTIPNQDNTDSLCDDYNKVIRWCEDRDSFQEYFSQSFENGIDVGINWLWMYPDYSSDPISGDLCTDSVSFNNVLWDQNFHKMDLSDCQGVWRRRWVAKTALKSLLPGYEKELEKIKPTGLKDGRFYMQAELQNLQLSNLYPYDEFYYRTTREAKIIIDPYTNQSMEWEDNENNPDGLYEEFLHRQPWLKVVKKQKSTIKLMISVSDKIVYDGPNSLSIDDYPCVPHLCYHEPDVLSYSGRVMGYIRNIRDAQFLYNMRKVIELQILQSQVNAGWIYPVDVVTDSKAFRQSSGGDGFLIPLKSGHLPNEIQRIEPSSLPSSLMELSRSLSEDITKITGVNEELLGMAEDDKSGILSMLRQSAGIVTLQNIFDKSDLTQRLYGKIRLAAIRKNFTKTKVSQILGHEPDAAFFSDFSQKYGVAVEEGNYSTTQRQTELQQLLHFRSLEIPISSKSIIRAAFITDKKRVIQEMEDEQKQLQQAQQQQAQQQSQIDQAKIQVDHAKAQELLASAQEKISQMEENRASAEHKLLEADYALIKTALELESAELEKVRQAFDIAQAIKNSAMKNNRSEVGLNQTTGGSNV